MIEYYQKIRQDTLNLVKELEIEDYVVQGAPFVSPIKWHLAHTSWFFETFVLGKLEHYRPYNKKFPQLFNSYYKTIGAHWVQGDRGMLSRPTVQEVMGYRKAVDEWMVSVLKDPHFSDIIEVGLQHELQHQELILMDMKYNFSVNPLYPHLKLEGSQKKEASCDLSFYAFEGGLVEVGSMPNTSKFSYDNETPRHKTYIYPFKMANRLVTNREYLVFMKNGGYEECRLWHSRGFDWTSKEKIQAPLYWIQKEGEYFVYNLRGGLSPIDLDTPVCHLSYYEASAYAEFSKKRLPTESEWEYVASNFSSDHNFAHLSGEYWQWTCSPYTAYPGYKKPSGAFGEYNAKFMDGQYILRGGSIFTPAQQVSTTYRNFFYPQDRWALTGLRLAEDI